MTPQQITVDNDWAIVIEHRTIDTRRMLGDIAVDDIIITLERST